MLTKERLECLFDHVVLPAYIGSSTAERADAFLSHDLGQLLLDAFYALREVGDADLWKSLQESLDATCAVQRTDGHKDSIMNAFRQISTTEDGRAWFGLHVAKQNAGLLIHKQRKCVGTPPSWKRYG